MAAILPLRTPEALAVDITSTSMSTTWEDWIQSVEMYFIASGITDQKRQKALLLYIGGKELQTIHRALNDDKETYNDTKTQLEGYFKPKANLCYLCHL